MSGRRQHWSTDENAALRRAVALYGEKCVCALPWRGWAPIRSSTGAAGVIALHTSQPKGAVATWTVSTMCGGLTQFVHADLVSECMKHWRKTMDPSLNHGAFTPEEVGIYQRDLLRTLIWT
jgi:hypothetical protein